MKRSIALHLSIIGSIIGAASLVLQSQVTSEWESDLFTRSKSWPCFASLENCKRGARRQFARNLREIPECQKETR